MTGKSPYRTITFTVYYSEDIEKWCVIDSTYIDGWYEEGIYSSCFDEKEKAIERAKEEAQKAEDNTDRESRVAIFNKGEKEPENIWVR